MSRMRTLVSGLATGLLGWSAAAADFDGSKPLLCTAKQVIECPVAAGCAQVRSEIVGLPDFWRVDVAGGRITATGEDGRESAIENVEHIDGKLILQGAEDGVEGVRDGTGWSAAIDEASGKMVATAAGDAVAFVLFGACIAQ